MDFFKKKRSDNQKAQKYFTVALETSTSNLWEIRKSENQREFFISLSKLKTSYRQVIILRKYYGYPIKEIGALLKWSESKVKTT